MDEFLFRFAVGAVGAGAFEALKLWKARSKLTDAKFWKLLRSPVLWIPLILMLTASGFVAWAFFDGQTNVKAWQLLMSGVAARTLIREGIEGWVAQKPEVKLGDEPTDSVSIRDVFS